MVNSISTNRIIHVKQEVVKRENKPNKDLFNKVSNWDVYVKKGGIKTNQITTNPDLSLDIEKIKKIIEKTKKIAREIWYSIDFNELIKKLKELFFQSYKLFL